MFGSIVSLFTFHHVSIKTFNKWICKRCGYSFTFHHVSIKTQNSCLQHPVHNHSHSTMYLLKLNVQKHLIAMHHDSHSTMYLLKPKDKSISCTIVFSFTFHHVSIKTQNHPEDDVDYTNSHSTMYLLKLLGDISPFFNTW